MRKPGGIVSGVVSATGAKFKFNKPLQCMKKPRRVASSPISKVVEVNVAVEIQPKLSTPYAPLTEDQIKEAVQDAYNRHLKRALGHEVNALDMTFHFLKHMGYNEVDWERMVKIMVVMKEEIDKISLTKK